MSAPATFGNGARANPSTRAFDRATIARAAIVWVAFALLFSLYASLRAAADGLQPANSGHGIESRLFGFVPSAFLQRHIDGAAALPLDFVGLAVHASWFPVPYVFGFFIMVRERSRLMEFLWWFLAASFAGCLVHALVPMTPPWMEGDAVRRMEELPLWSPLAYFDSDDNTVAAFPSLHAAMPLLAGLFCLLRLERLHWLGWVGIGHALVTGFFMVYLGEHWLFDILGGYALASLVTLAFASGAVFRLIDTLPFGVGEKMRALNEKVFPGPAPDVIPPAVRTDPLPRAA